MAPAGPFDRHSFEAGLSLIRARYQPTFDEGIFSQHRYLAGDDARRLSELQAALVDPTVRAVFCARGGYGSMRLLTAVDWARLPAKPVAGFSDITAIHQALQAAGRISVHAPVLTQLGKQPREVVERLYALLESAGPPPALTGRAGFDGVAEGPLLGGNLSVLTRLLGTPFWPKLDGAVLLLEDVGERPYRLDRMWTHLKLAGVFRQIRGIALGEFTSCEEPGGQPTSDEVLGELIQSTGLPCVRALPIGHGTINQPVPLGARVRLDGARGSLTFLEGAVAAVEQA